MPALRTTVSLMSDHSRVQVASASMPEDFRPDAWRYLYGWLENGWQVLSVHGNIDREAVALLEQHWGDPMRLSAVVTVKEKDDGTVKFKAVTDDVPGIPDDWDKGLFTWTKAGWELVDVTGNREHGAWWHFTKSTDDSAEAAS